MVYLYSYVKLFDDIRTSRYNSQKRCHATSRKLQPVYCAQCCLLSKIKAILGHFVITCWNVIIFLLRTFLERFLKYKISLSHWAFTVHAYQWETLSSFFQVSWTLHVLFYRAAHFRLSIYMVCNFSDWARLILSNQLDQNWVDCAWYLALFCKKFRVRQNLMRSKNFELGCEAAKKTCIHLYAFFPFKWNFIVSLLDHDIYDTKQVWTFLSVSINYPGFLFIILKMNLRCEILKYFMPRFF